MNLARTKAMVMMIRVFCRAQRIAYTNYRPYGLRDPGNGLRHRRAEGDSAGF